MILETLPAVFAICRLGPNDPVPEWATGGPFLSVSRTPQELSIVCQENKVPATVQAQRNWRCLAVKGVLDFNLTGILASIAGPLATAKISIFAVSTYDTDYILVKNEAFEMAIEVLTKSGHSCVRT